LIRAGLAGAFSLVLLFYILTEINEMRQEGWEYWCGKYKMQVVWNMIEIANLIMYVVVVAMLLYNYIVQWRLAEFDQSVEPPRLLALDVR
jgi:hypothetical protein